MYESALHSFVREPSSQVHKLLPGRRLKGILYSMSRFRVRRGAVVAALLVTALAVAAALTVQASRTARSHGAEADRVLRDYAALAAARVAQRSAQEIYYAVVPPLKALKHAHEMAPHKALPMPKDLHFDTMEHEFSLAPYIRVTFRMDLKTGQLTTSGQALPPAVRRWLIDTLPVHSRTVYDTSWHMGTVLGQPDGDRRYVAYTVLRDSKGGLPKSRLPLILGMLGLTAALIGTALFQLRRESQLTRLRTDFISGVSHELRTPLAQIRMFSETLTLGRVRSDEERRRSLAIIDQEARRLTHLVENLLHFSRSERQTAHITPEPTALGPLVQEVIDGFAPLAAARGATLSAAIPEDLVVTADPGAVRQMLLNLLDNAVKYGPTGQDVRIGATRETGVAKLWVDDGGPGIPRADRERVWERFWRLERDRESAVAGSGIGLAVVRELATLHHGRAWIDENGPAAGGGTRVVIELPV